VTRLFEDIAKRVVKESGARVVVMYGQVTEVGASVLHAWGHQGEADKVRLWDAFRAPMMLEESDPVHFIRDAHGDPFIDGTYAREENLQSAALFRLHMKDQVIVVAFGFAAARDFSNFGLHLYGLAARLALLASSINWPVESLTVLVEVIEEISHALESTSSLGAMLESLGGLLQRGLDHWNLHAHSSFWLLMHEPPVAGGKIVPRLRVEKGFGRGPRNPSVRQLDFDQGVIGWVAKYRSAVNVLPKRSGEKLPSGEEVSRHYLESDPQGRTQAELAVPLIYQNNLVGVLNIESPIAHRFGPEHVLLAHIVAAHAAQVIHQQRLEEFYNELLGMDDLKQLAQAFVREVGQFIEAPLSSVFLWDIQEQCLRLEAASAEVFDVAGAKVEPGQPCCPQRGVGFARWAFENRMWLLINDIPAFNDPAHRRHQAQQDELLNQIWRQCSPAGGVKQEREAGRPGDDRRFWNISLTREGASQPEVREVPEPLWSGDYHYREGEVRAQITIPILDPLPDRPALGVMCFSRRQEDRSFTEHDLNLLQGIARQVAHRIARAREQQSQELEKSLISEVVTMEPGSWDTEFQRRLEGQLAKVQRVTGADLVLVRARHGERELSLVAACPRQEDLSRQRNLRIPKIAYFGRGGSGRAAELGKPVHMPGADHPYLKEICDAAARPQDEQRFLEFLQSETAVPLLSGGKVIGTITAISFKPSSHRVRRERESRRWVSEQGGIHHLHTSLLEFHARWLGPALETIQQIVRPERQLSSLSTAARQLTELVAQFASPDLLTFATLVVATHNNGLRFHQAMVGELRQEEGGESVLLRAKEDFAWGCMTFLEQDHAHARRDSLERDLDNALHNRQNYCQGIRDAWRAHFFRCGLGSMPEGPCLVRRYTGRPLPSPSRGRIAWCLQAQPGSDPDRLLDDFCDLFGIRPESMAGRKMCVGTVPLGRPGDVGGPSSVLFVTNVVFHDPAKGDPEPASVEDFSCESLDALQDLANILRLAEAVARAAPPESTVPLPAAPNAPSTGDPHGFRARESDAVVGP
jgi:GAF domain-containing protein